MSAYALGSSAKHLFSKSDKALLGNERKRDKNCSLGSIGLVGLHDTGGSYSRGIVVASDLFLTHWPMVVPLCKGTGCSVGFNKRKDALPSSLGLETDEAANE